MVFVAACGLSLAVETGGYSLLEVHGSSLLWLLLLQNMGSVIVAHGLSCSEGLWDLPGPGIKAVFPAMAGRVLTTGPSGKSPTDF